MKKIFQNIMLLAALGVGFNSCHKLDVESTTELTDKTFPKTEAHFNALMGTIYTTYRNDFATNHFFINSHSTDEAVLPFYGTDWVDGNRYEQLHRHTWSPDHGHIDYEWYYLSNLIGNTNQVLYLLKGAEEGSIKTTSISEMRTMRALFFFYMMDAFGGVPLDTVYGNTELRSRATRTQVFDFVESELKASIPFLKTVSGTSTYGKPTRYMAYSLLAKMYLNSQVYTGTARNNEAIAACDSVMNAGGGVQYQLESRATYFNMFAPTNGPSFKEFIFAIPFDPATSNGYMFYSRYDLNRNLGLRYRYSGSNPGNNIDPIMNVSYPGLTNNKPSGPRCTTDEYYAYFNDPNDIRNNQWLTGLQYWSTGNPIMVRTTNLGYDQFYAGGTPGGSYTYHLNITPLGNGTRFGATSFDLGKDEKAWNSGYRNIKFSTDPNSITRNQNNDVPIFRLSDIVLMKAEAILRGGTATNGHTALSLINMLRAVRTTSAALGTVTLEDVYAERCREMSWELWHRNDMIRFGKYENPWGLNKTNADPNRRLFPIPTGALVKNSKLTQNPGYN